MGVLRCRRPAAACDEYLNDVRDWERVVARSLVARGCTYLQLDAPAMVPSCDPTNVEWHRAQGHDTVRELAFDAALDSSVFEGLEVVSRTSAVPLPSVRLVTMRRPCGASSTSICGRTSARTAPSSP